MISKLIQTTGWKSLLPNDSMTNQRDNIQITSENLGAAISQLQLMPQELRRAVRYAQLQAGKYARSQTRITFRKRTGITRVSRAKRRTSGSQARAWLGANPVPIRDIKGSVRVKRGVLRIKESGQNVEKSGYFLMKLPGVASNRYPVYRRYGKGRKDIEIVYADIYQQVQQAADDVIPGTKAILQEKFIEEAGKILQTTGARKFQSYKGKTEDRLSGIKYFRTTLR